MSRAFSVAALLALAALAARAGRAAAQDTVTAVEPGVQLILPAPAKLASESPAVRAVRMLTDHTTRTLLESGFPARLHYRLELWEARTLFDHLVTAMEWDVVVRYDRLAQNYSVTRIAGRVAPLGTFAALNDAEDAVARPYVPEIKLPTGHKRYYYFASLELDMLSVNDIDEVQRWLRGEAQPAIKGQEGAGTAIGRGATTLITRLFGGQKRVYTTRSVIFRP